MPLTIRYKPLKELVPYARNARTHSANQIGKLKASLAEFGWTNPMLIADGGMLAGHGRLQAALEMAEAGTDIRENPDPWKGPTIDLSHLSKTQRKAYILADNRLAMDAGWDPDLLRLEFADLSAESFALDLTGFNATELRDVLDGMDGTSASREERDEAGHEGSAYTEQYGVIVICKTSKEQEMVFNKLAAEGYTLKVVTT